MFNRQRSVLNPAEERGSLEIKMQTRNWKKGCRNSIINILEENSHGSLYAILQNRTLVCLEIVIQKTKQSGFQIVC